MNFAYLDARSLLESVFVAPPPEPIEPVPCTLDEDWVKLTETLSRFKIEYAKTRRDLMHKTSELNQKKDELSILTMMAENLHSLDLKDRISTMVEDYEHEQDLVTLKQECAELAGRSQAQKKVLQDTDPERYARFTCFVCMERLVDLFIDPCGHVICEPCWSRTQNKTTCPGCRTRIADTKRIFTLS